jgi:uncharacterized protein (DUF1499 family)
MAHAIVSDPLDGPVPRARVAPGLAWAALLIALAGGLGELLAGLGYRRHWWGVSGGIATMQWSAIAALGAFVVALIALVVAWRSHAGRATRIAAFALVVGLLAGAPPVWFAREATRLPDIHDISTDTDNPPRFVAIVPLRAGAPNGLAIDADAIAKQKASYADIAPARLPVAPARAFDLADRAARAMGWEIVALVPAEGRIEATATTLLFGFKDDVVIRVSPDGEGSRVDLRSVSRVGRSDLGANARRVRAYLKELAAQQRAE